MSKKGLLTVFFTLIVLLSGFDAYAQKSKQNYEIMRLIRHEKFDLILPGALRDNKVDMWIHVVESGNRDPLALDLGGWFEFRLWEPIGYYLFTDRGGDRIERIILGGSDRESLYDIRGSGDDLLKLVEERDPEVIAVNMSNSLTIANGLSYTAYFKLTEALGEKYTDRLISAENVITDFRVRRIQREIIAFSNAVEIQRQIMEKALTDIKPGITTREDVGWWAADQLLAQGISATFQSATLFLPYMPGVSHSESQNRSENRAFQRGDFLSWDMGVGYLNFGTDIKRNAYILKEGETDIPDGLKLAWERGMKGREIIRKALKVGRSSEESWTNIVRAFEAEGYVHTPSDDRTSQYRDSMVDLGDDKRSGFSLGLHPTGNTSVGDVASGPYIASFRPDRSQFMVLPNFIFAFEFVINTWVPEWNRRISINFEDNAIVTSNGVEYLYPYNEKILLIR